MNISGWETCTWSPPYSSSHFSERHKPLPQEQLKKDKDITFRDRAHPTLRNPAHPTIHLIPAEGKAAEAKPKDWAVTGGVSAWLWFGAFPWTVL